LLITKIDHATTVTIFKLGRDRGQTTLCCIGEERNDVRRADDRKHEESRGCTTPGAIRIHAGVRLTVDPDCLG